MKDIADHAEKKYIFLYNLIRVDTFTIDILCNRNLSVKDLQGHAEVRTGLHLLKHHASTEIESVPNNIHILRESNIEGVL